METLGPSSGISPLLRPSVALQSNLIALMREGRVLAGEVLERLDGGTYVIGVAGRRVPAQSPSELEVGTRLRLELVRNGNDVALRILPERESAPRPPRDEPALFRVLRGLARANPALAEVLVELESLLSSGGERQAGESREVLESLLKALGGRLLDPDAIAAGLRGVLRPDVRAGRSALFAALAESGADSLPRAVANLASQFGRLLASELAARGLTAEAALVLGAGSELEELLGSALRNLAGRGAELSGGRGVGGLKEWSALLEAELVRVLKQGGRNPARAALLAALSARNRPAGACGLDPALLRVLFLADELPGGAELARGARGTALGALGGDLEGRLLQALLELPQGETREAALRTLASLDLEHLLNLARSASSEPLHWSFLIPDGPDRRAAVELFLAHRDSKGKNSAADDAGVWRWTLGVEFSAFGPLRADLLLRDGRLSARLLVTRPEVAMLLSRHLEALQEELSPPLGGNAGGAARGRARVSVAVASPEQASVGRLVREVGILEERHLMDEVA
jgi:hypothetical protein